MQIADAAKSRVIDIADRAERNGFSGLRQVSAGVTPEALIEVDPPDLLGTRTDAFVANGNLYVTHGDAIYVVGALSGIPELSGSFDQQRPTAAAGPR